MAASIENANASIGESLNRSPVQPLGPKERFYRYFQEEVISLQEQIQNLGAFALVGGERQDAIDHCLAGISRLTTEVSDASSSLPPYDQRAYSKAVKALSELLQEKRTTIAPRPKFSFRTSKKNGSAISLTDAAEMAQAQRLRVPQMSSAFSSSNESSISPSPAPVMTPPSEAEISARDTIGDLPSFLPKNYNAELSMSSSKPIRKPSFSQSKNVSISGHSGLHIILPSSASHATSWGSLTKLNRCILDMSIPTASGAPFAGLMLKNIKHSLIVAGHVAGATHLTAVENSVIVVNSRQVRMHDCKNVDVYLYCTGRPIIEDCSDVRFAPIPECYTKPSDGSTRNQWDQVDDFKWLKSEPSPNWSVLPERERVDEVVWTTVVPGTPSSGPDDILKAVGIYGR